jgi:hypothetical protein
MGAILKIIGIIGVTGFLLKSSASSYLDKIKVGFKELSKENFSLFKSEMKLTLVITNNNDFRIFVDDFIGAASYGKMILEVRMKKQSSHDGVYVLEPGQTIAFSFSVKVRNSEFFLQLAEQVESKEIPYLRITGELIGGLSKDQLFKLPVNQSIQIL